VNLPSILDGLRSTKVDGHITLKDGLKITVRPLTYKDMTSTSLHTFQQQKMYTAIQDSQLSDEEKAKRFNDAFKTLTELNASILLKNIEMVTMTDGTEITDPGHIKEFIENANATLVKEIEDKLMQLRGQGAVKPLKLKATEDQIKKGAPATYEVPVTFDTANFFV
jgi:predicted nucleotide-binding protein (sugar kinase/HSP70/actin superfamily)